MLLARAVGTALAVFAGFVGSPLLGAEPPTVKFTGKGMDFQALLNRVPAGTVVVCEQAQPLVVAKTITIGKPMTLRGLKAKLPEKLGKTTLLVVASSGVTLLDLELHGNYSSVNQKDRAPLLHVKTGGFRIERCKFFDGSKDGIMVTPDDGAGDIVGGTIRDIEGARMGRDAVSLSGGNRGQRIRNVTVENVRLKVGYFRGAVEVSDGTDNITVRHVHADSALYAIDVQDHGRGSAPNTNVTLEDVTAVNCKHIIRTANHPLGHANLAMSDFTAKNCGRPVQISNTTHVRIKNLAIVSEPAAETSRITLRHCDDVVLQNVTITGLKDGVGAVDKRNSTNVTIKALSLNGKAVPTDSDSK
jgi:hypothetical protein